MHTQTLVENLVDLTPRSQYTPMRTLLATLLGLALLALVSPPPAQAASRPAPMPAIQPTLLPELKLSPDQWIKLETGLAPYSPESLQNNPASALEVIRVLADVLTPSQRQQLDNQWDLNQSAVNSTVYPSLCRVSTKAGLIFTRTATALCDGSKYTDTEAMINEAADMAAQSALTCSFSNTDPCLWGSSYALAVPYYISTEIYGFTACRLYTPALVVEYAAFILCGSAN